MEQITTEEDKKETDISPIYNRYYDEDDAVIDELEHHDIVKFGSSVWWMHFARDTVKKDEYMSVQTAGTGGWPIIEYYKKIDTNFEPANNYRPSVNEIVCCRQRSDPVSPVRYKLLSPNTDYIFGYMFDAVLYRSKTRYLDRMIAMRLHVKPSKREEEE